MATSDLDGLRLQEWDFLLRTEPGFGRIPDRDVVHAPSHPSGPPERLGRKKLSGTVEADETFNG